MVFVGVNTTGDTTTTTGTGTLTLAGVAPTGYNPIVGNVANNANIYIRIETTDGVSFEVCESVYNSGAQTVTRGNVLVSSNGGAAVSFAAGTKNVLIVWPDEARRPVQQAAAIYAAQNFS